MPPGFLDTPEDFDPLDDTFYGLMVSINLCIKSDLLRASWWLEWSDEVRITNIPLVTKQVLFLKQFIKQAMSCYGYVMNTAFEWAFDPDYVGVEEGTYELIFHSMALLFDTIILPFPQRLLNRSLCAVNNATQPNMWPFTKSTCKMDLLPR
jgi:hypothetical protein